MLEYIVVIYFSRLGTPLLAHERATLAAVANAIAQIKHCEFAGCYDGGRQNSGPIFVVPDDTLMLDEALSLGVRSPRNLFGGVVTYPFAKTKAISHQLVDDRAKRPPGWSSAFAQSVSNVVLPGFTVFSIRDARVAAKHLLDLGPIRLKRSLACGGRDQALVTVIDELDAFLEKVTRDEFAVYGLVLEANLHRVTTLSIGQIMIDDFTVTYHGTQRVTADNKRQSVYGGSDLICVRGGWEALDALPMSAEVRLGVAQATAYEEAMATYPGFIASRRNYDVGQGIDEKGQWRSGVFEASWRSGGASTAELAALTAFARDPALQVVEASAVKEFGKGREAPRDSVIHFQGDDPEDGPLLRYTVVTRALRQAA